MSRSSRSLNEAACDWTADTKPPNERDIEIEAYPAVIDQHIRRRGLWSPHVARLSQTRLVPIPRLGHQDVSVEASGDRLIFYRAGKRIKPEEVRSFMEEGFGV